MSNQSYSPAWPHGDLAEIFDNIFFITGTNITTHDQVEYQHSRNMVIVREGDELTLINTVRLTDPGLAALDQLGTVKHLIRIGAFHGRDDAFYQDRYQASLWALDGMHHQFHRLADELLKPNLELPFPNASFFHFETSRHPEGIIHIAKEGGILITCDSIKNWVAPDPFFSEDTAQRYRAMGYFGTATISAIWKQASQVQSSDFMKLKKLKFQHLLSAHGEPLLNHAFEAAENTIQKEF